jgi:hypothetical protein
MNWKGCGMILRIINGGFFISITGIPEQFFQKETNY